MGLTDVADAERQLQAAIELGELTAQHAPAGHPIFDAIGNAQEVLAFLQDEEDLVGPALVPGTRTYAQVQGAIDGVYAAAGEVRNEPDKPLLPTFFSLPKISIPWFEIAAGGGALALGFFLFQRHRRRRRHA